MNLAHAYERLMSDPYETFLVPPSSEENEEVIPFYSTRYALYETIQIFPGSFDPLHDAHKAIFDAVRGGQDINNKRILFELSLSRVGKNDIDLPELDKRLRQFQRYAPVWITRASLFIEKIGLMPNLSPYFHVGMDTASRLISAHGNIGVQGLRAKFYVYPRANADGKLSHVHEITGRVPFNFLHADHPRPDLVGLSSTQIRSSSSLNQSSSQ